MKCAPTRKGRRAAWVPPLGGSKGGNSSRASLHSKAVIIDKRLAVIGSMNLDLRSQLKNSEVALLIRSTAVSQEAQRQVEATLAQGAYRLDLDKDQLVWRAPPGGCLPGRAQRAARPAPG